MAASESLSGRMNRFFHTSEIPYACALMRVVLSMSLILIMADRWPHVREIYSADGSPAQLGVGYGYPAFMPEFSGEVAVALFTVMLVAFVTSAIGWQTRISLGASLVLFAYFNLLDAASTMTKYSVIASHLLLLLLVSPCGEIWSVDSWIKRNGQAPAEPPRFPGWARRLMQLNIGLVYFGAAITKIHTPAFFSGDQVQFWMLTHVNYRHYLGELLSLFPVCIVLMSYCVVVWEILVVFVGWKSMGRSWILPLGVFFHTMTMLTLGLFAFPMICFCAYLAFIDEDDLHELQRSLLSHQWLQRSFSNWSTFIARIRPTPSTVWHARSAPAYCLLVLSFAVLGVFAEHIQDPYQLRRAGGPLPLVALSHEKASMYLAPTEPRSDLDRFFCVDTGSIMLGGMLADRRKVFSPGETMIAECHLMPLHEDMWIDCSLYDDENRLLNRQISVAPREVSRLSFRYPLCNQTPPGNYALIVKTAGREVLRKQVKVSPRRWWQVVGTFWGT